MGILKRIGRAVSRGLEELEAGSGSTSAPSGGSEFWSEHRQPTETGDVGGLTKELAFYKRRSREYFALIQKMEAQREEWKSLYQRDSQGHQSAQAVLQEHIVTLRTQVVGLIQMINAHRKEKGEQPIDLSKLVLDLHAYPVGIAEATAERNAHDLASVAPQTGAAEALAAIHEAVPVPDGTPPLESGPPKIS